jgi:hypothetical protein
VNQYWTAHLQDPEEKQRFINQVAGSKEVLERLRDIIQVKEQELGEAERSQKAYGVPNWDYLQAHRNGYSQGLSAIKKFLTPDQESK